jgi:hypothetical protein
MQILLFLLPAVAFAAHPAPAYGGYGHPKLYCRDTNTSVYAEVCVPQFRQEVTPETLAVKIVVPDQFCYNRVITTCVETSTTNAHTLCTSTYEAVEQAFKLGEELSGHVTQVTYEDKSETMRVTTCKASGYGAPQHYGAGEHQYCREEYQTQAYKVPLVTADLEVELALSEPQPVEVCTDVEVEITEVKCSDAEEEKCIDLVKFEDSTNTINTETAVISEEPNCSQVTLTLPTKACSKPY